MTANLLNQDERVARIFISSTFRDLKEERNYITEVVFPRLKNHFKSRNVKIVEVDLRWGVTRRDALDGRTVEICLNEVERCKPFFIGILGERYGWTPTKSDISDDSHILARYPWLREMVEDGRSITEMEFALGAFRSNETAAFFVKDSIEGDKNDVDAIKQEDIRQRILEQKQYPVMRFASAAELGDKLFETIRIMIEKVFPVPDTAQDSISNMCATQDFLLTRFWNGYVERHNHEEDLMEFINGYASQMQYAQITGEAGCGKSMFIANFVKKLRVAAPEINVVPCMVSDSLLTHKVNLANYMIRRVCDVISPDVNFVQLKPDSKDPEIFNMLSECLSMLKNHGEWLFIIDGIDNLEIADRSYALEWLPKMPANVKLILTMREKDNYGFFYYAVRQTGSLLAAVHNVNIEKFNAVEIRDLCTDYLSEYGKSLDVDLMDTLAKGETTTHPLLVKLILDNLRICGSFETLPAQLDRLVRSKDQADLVLKILQDISGVLDRHTPGALKHLLSFVYGSRYGYSEDELAALSGLSGICVAVILEVCDAFLCYCGGRITIQKWAAEIIGKYVRTDNDFKETGLRIKGYLESRMAQGIDQTILNEYPYVLLGLADYESLAVFAERADVLGHWNDLDPVTKSEWKIYVEPAIRYGNLTARLENADISPDFAGLWLEVAKYLRDLRHYQTSVRILTKLLDALMTEPGYDDQDKWLKINIMLELTSYLYQDHMSIAPSELTDRIYAMLRKGERKDDLTFVEIDSSIGWSMFKLGFAESALKCFVRGCHSIMQAKEAHGYSDEEWYPVLGLLYSRTALAYSSLGMKDRMMELADSAYSISQRLLDISPITYNELALEILSNVINAFIASGYYDEAIAVFNIITPTFNDYSAKFPQRHAISFGHILTNIGSIYKTKGDVEKAYRFLNDSLTQITNYLDAMAGNIDSNVGFGVMTYYILGEILLSENYRQEALQHYLASLNLAGIICPGDFSIIQFIEPLMSRLSELEDDENTKEIDSVIIDFGYTLSLALNEKRESVANSMDVDKMEKLLAALNFSAVCINENEREYDKRSDVIQETIQWLFDAYDNRSHIYE